jgi:hypothetical protein
MDGTNLAMAAGDGAAVTLAALAALHLYWGLGGRTELIAAVPERLDGRPKFTPGRTATLIVAAALAGSAILVATRAAAINLPVPSWVSAAGCWVIALVFVARAIGDFRYIGFTKRVRGTHFARLDDAIYSPLCVLLGAACALVAAWGRTR